MKKMKRVLSLTLALLMVLSLLPVTAFADVDAKTYTLVLDEENSEGEWDQVISITLTDESASFSYKGETVSVPAAEGHYESSDWDADPYWTVTASYDEDDVLAEVSLSLITGEEGDVYSATYLPCPHSNRNDAPWATCQHGGKHPADGVEEVPPIFCCSVCGAYLDEYGAELTAQQLADYISLDPIDHTYNGAYVIGEGENEGKHALKCSSDGCNEVGDWYPHNFTNGNCVCGAEKPAPAHTQLTGFAGGDGSAEKPYQISSAAQLENLAKIVNDGNTCADTYFELTDDIGSTDEPVTTKIGCYDPSIPLEVPFNGYFDGNGYTVTLGIKQTDGMSAGLFGMIGEQAEITNVTTAGSVSVERCEDVGGVCGYNKGTIINCYNTGTVNGTSGVGGVCGKNEGTIINCYNIGNVSEVGFVVGGVCGNNYGTITNCYNTGDVCGTLCKVGGVCGYNKGAITNCYNTGTVSGEDGCYYLGGVFGYNCYGTIANCYYNDAGYDIIGVDEEGEGGKDCYKLSTTQMQAAAGSTLSTGVANNKPLVDLLNNYVTAHSSDNLRAWTNKQGEYPVFSTPHTHTLTEVKTCAATCTTDGVKTAYWQCTGEDGCGKCFTAATDGTEISTETLAADYIEDAKGHNFSGNAVSNENGTHSFQCVNGCGEYGGTVECVDELGDGFCDICGKELPASDFTALNAAIAAFEALTEDDYTAATWAVAAKAYDDAVAAKSATKQADVDTAASALDTAIKALVKASKTFNITATTVEIQVGATEMQVKLSDAEGNVFCFYMKNRTSLEYGRTYELDNELYRGHTCFRAAGGNTVLGCSAASFTWAKETDGSASITAKMTINPTGDVYNITAVHNHSFTNGYVIGTGENEGKHALKCLCGEADEYVAHDFTQGDCVCGAKDWTEWVPFESGVGVWTHRVGLPSEKTALVGVKIRQDNNNENVKQLLIEGWGNNIWTQNGVDLIIDWNQNTGVLSIQEQPTGYYYNGEPVLYSDYNLNTGTMEYPCSYDSETHTFSFAVIGESYSYYFGAYYEYLQMHLECVDGDGDYVCDICGKEMPASDFTVLEAAISAFAELTEDDYTAATWAVAAKACDDAVAAKSATTQNAVNAAAKALNDAIGALKKAGPADYTKVNDAITAVDGYNPDNYRDFSAVETAIGDIKTGLNENHQDEVNAMAQAILDALANLELKDADYTAVDAAIAKIPSDLSGYTDASVAALNKAINDVDRIKNITEQDEVDAMAQAIEDAIAALEKKPREKSQLEQLTEMLEAYLETAGKLVRRTIEATVKAMKNTEALIKYLMNLFGIKF